MMENRRKLKKSPLETMEEPVQGLVKQYRKPFSNYAPDTPDAHEALKLKDHCMAKYTKKGRIAVLQ